LEEAGRKREMMNIEKCGKGGERGCQI